MAANRFAAWVARLLRSPTLRTAALLVLVVVALAPLLCFPRPRTAASSSSLSNSASYEKRRSFIRAAIPLQEVTTITAGEVVPRNEGGAPDRLQASDTPLVTVPVDGVREQSTAMHRLSQENEPGIESLLSTVVPAATAAAERSADGREQSNINSSESKVEPYGVMRTTIVTRECSATLRAQLRSLSSLELAAWHLRLIAELERNIEDVVVATPNNQSIDKLPPPRLSDLESLARRYRHLLFPFATVWPRATYDLMQASPFAAHLLLSPPPVSEEECTSQHVSRPWRRSTTLRGASELDRLAFCLVESAAYSGSIRWESAELAGGPHRNHVTRDLELSCGGHTALAASRNSSTQVKTHKDSSAAFDLKATATVRTNSLRAMRQSHSWRRRAAQSRIRQRSSGNNGASRRTAPVLVDIGIPHSLFVKPGVTQTTSATTEEEEQGRTSEGTAATWKPFDVAPLPLHEPWWSSPATEALLEQRRNDDSGGATRNATAEGAAESKPSRNRVEAPWRSGVRLRSTMQLLQRSLFVHLGPWRPGASGLLPRESANGSAATFSSTRWNETLFFSGTELRDFLESFPTPLFEQSTTTTPPGRKSHRQSPSSSWWTPLPSSEMAVTVVRATMTPDAMTVLAALLPANRSSSSSSSLTDEISFFRDAAISVDSEDRYTMLMHAQHFVSERSKSGVLLKRRTVDTAAAATSTPSLDDAEAVALPVAVWVADLAAVPQQRLDLRVLLAIAAGSIPLWDVAIGSGAAGKKVALRTHYFDPGCDKCFPSLPHDQLMQAQELAGVRFEYSTALDADVPLVQWARFRRELVDAYATARSELIRHGRKHMTTLAMALHVIRLSGALSARHVLVAADSRESEIENEIDVEVAPFALLHGLCELGISVVVSKGTVLRYHQSSWIRELFPGILYRCDNMTTPRELGSSARGTRGDDNDGRRKAGDGSVAGEEGRACADEITSRPFSKAGYPDFRCPWKLLQSSSSSLTADALAAQLRAVDAVIGITDEGPRGSGEAATFMRRVAANDDDNREFASSGEPRVTPRLAVMYTGLYPDVMGPAAEWANWCSSRITNRSNAADAGAAAVLIRTSRVNVASHPTGFALHLAQNSSSSTGSGVISVVPILERLPPERPTRMVVETDAQREAELCRRLPAISSGAPSLLSSSGVDKRLRSVPPVKRRQGRSTATVPTSTGGKYAPVLVSFGGTRCSLRALVSSTMHNVWRVWYRLHVGSDGGGALRPGNSIAGGQQDDLARGGSLDVAAWLRSRSATHAPGVLSPRELTFSVAGPISVKPKVLKEIREATGCALRWSGDAHTIFVIMEGCRDSTAAAEARRAFTKSSRI